MCGRNQLEPLAPRFENEVKSEKKGDGKYRIEKICDETLSGFQDVVVPVDELFIEKFSLTNIDTEEHLEFSMPLTL
jgi:hypothetical protein